MSKNKVKNIIVEEYVIIINNNTTQKKLNDKSTEIINEEEKDITTKLVEQHNERQDINNKNAYEAIKINPKKPNKDNINENALDRLLSFTEYKNIDELKKDKDNLEDNIMKLSALYIAKNASRQSTKDEGLQLENINVLQEHGITIIKDGKLKPIKGGGIRKSGKNKQMNLKQLIF